MIGLRNREGVSLVEVIIAMTLLGVVLTSLAGMTYQASRRSATVATESYRQGVLMEEVNRLTALPFTNLASAVGCRTVTGGAFPHQRCVSMTSISSTIRRLTVIVTPSQPGMRPDTVIFDRANAPAGNPLNLGAP